MKPSSPEMALSAPSQLEAPALPGAPRSLSRRLEVVLQPLLVNTGASRCSVRKLADGGQACLFIVSGRDKWAPSAADGDAEEMVAKVYYDDTPEARKAARDEHDCLRRLHARLDGITQDGWTIRCPRPLQWSDAAAALVMTRVPGHPLSWHLARGKGPSEAVLDSVARATVSCLRRYWEGEARLYGDLILNNVLCDVPSRTLSLVDPGMPEPFYECAAAPRAWYPASRDLGFLLFWVGSLVRPSLAHPVLHARQKRMAGRIVRTFLDGLPSPEQRQELIGEIEACARLHLGRMSVSATPKGLWRRVVRRAAAKTIDRTLGQLRAAEMLSTRRTTAAC